MLTTLKFLSLVISYDTHPPPYWCDWLAHCCSG